MVMQRVPTNLLYVPALSERKLDKMRTAGASGYILDLEDSVDESMKAVARDRARMYIDRDGATLQLYVRVNGIRTTAFAEDVRAVVRPGLRGLILPKVERPEDLQEVDVLLDDLEKASGLDTRTVRILASIESAVGAHNIEAIAYASDRLSLMSLGYGDLRRDFGILSSRDAFLRSGLCESIRARIAIASRAAGLEPPHDGARDDWSDLDGLAAECELALRSGFGGKRAIHPAQLETIRRAFEVSEESRRWATSVIAAMGHGGGATRVGGSEQMVDIATLRYAQSLIEKERGR